MKRIVYTEKSLADFDSILDYIAKRNPEAATKLGKGLLVTCELIGKNPNLGIRRGPTDTTLRMFSYRGYAIYYRNLNQYIDVLRILHHALDHDMQELE